MDLKKIKKDYNFLICLIFAILALFCNLIAFLSPYWIVSNEKMHSDFVNIGLWVACFDNYEHPEDYVSKKYSGCWYTYWQEYDYIRDWLNPPWFYAVQMLSSLTLLCNGVALSIILLKYIEVLNSKYLITNLLSMFIQLIAVFAYIIVTVSMGVMSKDRNWMPRPDHNYLAWSYGLYVVAAFFTIFCLFNLVIHYIIHNRAPIYKEKFKKDNKVPLMNICDNTINKSHNGDKSDIKVGNPGGSTIYSQVGKSNFGLTSGATASAKVREAMSQKKNAYGGSVASLNSFGQLNKVGSVHSLASLSRIPQPPMNTKGSMSSIHSNYRPVRNNNISSNDSVV